VVTAFVDKLRQMGPNPLKETQVVKA